MLINSKISKWFFHKYFAIPRNVDVFKIGRNTIHYWKDKSKNEAICRQYQNNLWHIPIINRLKYFLFLPFLFIKNPLVLLMLTTGLDTGSVNNKDTSIWKVSPDHNCGSDTSIEVQWYSDASNTRRILIHFTLTPQFYGRINKVSLKLTNASGGASGYIEVHSLTQTAWTEAGATWNKYDGVNNWGTSGGSFNATIIRSFISDATLGAINTFDIMGGSADNSLTLNWGSELHLLIKTPEAAANNYLTIATKEHATTAYRPYLEITYLPFKFQYGKARISTTPTPTGIYFYANAVDRTNYIDWQTFTIEDLINHQVDTCSFKTIKYGTKTWIPAVGDTIRIMNGLDDIFGGIIVQIEKSVDSLILSYKVDCKDYTQYLDRFLVTESYTSQTVNDIIADIVSKYLTNFSPLSINCSTVIPTISFTKMTVSQCLEELAERVNYSWYIDPYKVIHFIVQGSENAPFGLTDTIGNYNFGSLLVNEDITQLRNKIYIQGTTGVTALVQDATSIATYGTYEYSLTDTTILSNDEATQYANAMLSAYANPLKSGSFTTYQSGLRSGQLINVQSAIRGLNDNYIIQRVTMTMHAPSNPMWTVEFATLRDLGIIQFFQKMLIFQANLATNI